MLGQHRPAELTKGCGRGCRERRNCEIRGWVGSKSGRGAGSSWKGMGCPKMPWGCCGNFPERGDQDLSLNILLLASRNNSKQSDKNIPHLHNILPGWQIFVVHSLIKSNICSLSAVCIQRMYLETVKSTTEWFWKYWHFPRALEWGNLEHFWLTELWMSQWMAGQMRQQSWGRRRRWTSGNRWNSRWILSEVAVMFSKSGSSLSSPANSPIQ